MSGGAIKILVSSGLVGVAAWTTVFPLDVIKTHVQTREVSYTAITLSPFNECASKQVGILSKIDGSRNGILAVARDACAVRGPRAFWRGIRKRCARTFLVNAVQ